MIVRTQIMWRLSVIGLCLLAFGLLLPRASQALPYSVIRYVAVTGTDAGACANPASPCRTLQYAVTQAAAGDEVRVAAGAYTDLHGFDTFTQVVFISRSITLRGGYTTADWSTANPTANITTLDAGGQGRGVVIAGDGLTTSVEGFRIINGYGEAGGGVLIMQGAAATLRGNEIFSNTSATFGGGVMLESSPALVQNNWVASNTAQYAGGVAVYYSDDARMVDNRLISNTADMGGGAAVAGSRAYLTGNLVIDNYAGDFGGGLGLIESAASLYNNTFTGNAAGQSGGGIMMGLSPASFVSNTIAQNRAVIDNGGGLWLGLSAATFVNNAVLSNTATSTGGGFYLYQSTATLTGNRFISNTALTWNGGGLNLEESSAVFMSNTLTLNTATYRGGALYLDTCLTPTVEANLIYSNSAGNGGGGVALDSSPITLTHNRILSNSAQVGGGLHLKYSDATVFNNQIDGNRATTQGGGAQLVGHAPRLISNTLRSNRAGSQGGALNSDWGSQPVLEDNLIRDNTAAYGGGALRVFGSAITLRRNTILSNTATSGGGGAIQLFLAGGSQFFSNTLAYNQSSGYDGGGAVYLFQAGNVWFDHNHFEQNHTTSDGGALNAYNSAGLRLTHNTFLSNALTNTGNGGALYCNTCPAAEIDANTVRGNSAVHNGGGLAFQSSPGVIISGTLFDGNATTYFDGGGLDVRYSPDARVQANTFTDNHIIYGQPWGGGGGGLNVDNSNGTLVTGNWFQGNTITNTSDRRGGGALRVGSLDGVTISGNVLVTNTAGNLGGGLQLDYARNATLSNNVIADNAAPLGAGLHAGGSTVNALHTTLAQHAADAVYVTGATWNGSANSTAAFTNSVIVSNAMGVYVNTGSAATLHATLWTDNGLDTYGDGSITTGTLNYTGQPGFANPIGWAYTLTAASAAIDQGVAAGVFTDRDDHLRDVAPDLGAYEYQPSGAGLWAYQTVSAETVRSGWPLTYSLYVGNYGDTALSINVTATLPAHVTPGGSVTWTIDLAPNQLWMQVWPVTTDIAYSGTLTNVLRATAPGAAHTYTRTSQAQSVAALHVSKTGTPATVLEGQRLTYTLRITNTGSVTLTADITDTLPAQVTPAGPLTWLNQTIPAPQGVWSTTVVVTAQLGYGGSLINQLAVTTDEGASGSAQSTNAAYVSSAALRVSKTAVPVAARPGDRITYTLRVDNIGNVGLHVDVTDTLPAQVAPTGVLTWFNQAIVSAGSWTQSVVVTASNAYTGTLTNTLTARGYEGGADTVTHTLRVGPGVVRYVAVSGSDTTDCAISAAPCASVQYAIDRSLPGDEIRLAGGDYSGVQARPRVDVAGGTTYQVAYITQPLTLRGGYTTTDWLVANPAANVTTLNANSSGRVLYVVGDFPVTIEGVSLINGRANGLGGFLTTWGSAYDAGGGLYVLSSTLTLYNSQVRSSTSSYYGGGVFVLRAANAQIISSTLRQNTATYDGGGLHLNQSPQAVISATIFLSNTTTWSGGGAYVYGSDQPTLVYNTFTGNQAANGWPNDGGGLYVGSGRGGLIGYNMLTGNRANSNGAAIRAYYQPGLSLIGNVAERNTGTGLSLEGGEALVTANRVLTSTSSGLHVLSVAPVTVTGNVLRGNGQSFQGGGAQLSSSTGVFTGNLVADNRAMLHGGGVAVYGSRLNVAENDIVSNTADAGGGLFADGSQLQIANNNFLSNTATHGGGVSTGSSANQVLTLTANLISGNTALNTGGGLQSDVNVSLVITGNQVVSNTALTGGGLHLSGGTPQISHNRLAFNQVAQSGGGVALEGSAALVTANTLDHNQAQASGGGVLLINSPATLTHNSLLTNTASVQGGGLSAQNSAAWLSDNTLCGNQAAMGGGVYLLNSAATLEHNLLAANLAQQGGGAALLASPATVTLNTFDGNQASGFGGGLLLTSSAATIHDNTITHNTGGDGGGVFSAYSDLDLQRNAIRSNSATKAGGGVYAQGGAATWINNLIADNVATQHGSGLHLQGAMPRILHSTVVGNMGGSAGVVVDGEVTVTLTNTLIASHTLGVQVAAGSAARSEAALWAGNSTHFGGNVIDVSPRAGDPKFVASDDYHLGSGSAAIDAGVNAGVTDDIDHEARPNQLPDIGVDEVWTCQPISAVGIGGANSGSPNTPITLTGIITPAAATQPITLTWSPAPLTGQGTPTAAYTFATAGVYTVTLTAQNCGATQVATHTLTISAAPQPPAAPALIAPPNGTITTATSIHLQWQAGSGGTPIGYNVDVNGSIITTTSTTSSTNLAIGTHTWTVRAYNAAGYSAWASPWSVTVELYKVYLPLVRRN